jgi:hypothetical protein
MARATPVYKPSLENLLARAEGRHPIELPDAYRDPIRHTWESNGV